MACTEAEASSTTKSCDVCMVNDNRVLWLGIVEISKNVEYIASKENRSGSTDEKETIVDQLCSLI